MNISINRIAHDPSQDIQDRDQSARRVIHSRDKSAWIGIYWGQGAGSPAKHTVIRTLKNRYLGVWRGRLLCSKRLLTLPFPTEGSKTFVMLSFVGERERKEVVDRDDEDTRCSTRSFPSGCSALAHFVEQHNLSSPFCNAIHSGVEMFQVINHWSTAVQLHHWTRMIGSHRTDAIGHQLQSFKSPQR